jgi:uncharacterized protein YjiS (DUF1127 family)
MSTKLNFSKFAGRVSQWHHRMRSRRELMLLGDIELADMSLSRTDARSEASKWFWQS